MLNCVSCKFARAIVINCVLHDSEFIERGCFGVGVFLEFRGVQELAPMEQRRAADATGERIIYDYNFLFEFHSNFTRERRTRSKNRSSTRDLKILSVGGPRLKIYTPDCYYRELLKGLWHDVSTRKWNESIIPQDPMCVIRIGKISVLPYTESFPNYIRTLDEIIILVPLFIINTYIYFCDVS